MNNFQGVDSDGGKSSRWFTTTHWTVVVNAKSDDTARAAEAVGSLCRTYWRPVNAYVRTWRNNPADADDLTQQFFARFLEKEHYKAATPDRGRFRSFLLTAVKHFLINEQERVSALKRGGGKPHVSLDELDTKGERPRLEIPDERTAERAYEQAWALSLLGTVRKRLQSEYAQQGLGERFAQSERFLPGEEPDLTYAEAAAQCGVPEGTLKSDVHRLKRRYRELLREEIAHTVLTSEEIEDELRHLIRVLG